MTDKPLVTITAVQWAEALRKAEAKALRELVQDAEGNSRLPVLDGGSSYIDILRRADEIEAGR